MPSVARSHLADFHVDTVVPAYVVTQLSVTIHAYPRDYKVKPSLLISDLVVKEGTVEGLLIACSPLSWFL